MAALLLIVLGVCAVAWAAPEASYMDPAQMQQKNALLSRLEYYLDPNYGEAATYYDEQHKQAATRPRRPEALESLEPDSEVELLPGAPPPQPPQQTPVAPSVPGLVPGQRVYIVHMPIPGYRPGAVGGYQPIYIVAAAPPAPANAPYPGYQNAVVVSPSQEFSPESGYAPAAPPLRPFQFAYHHPYQALQPMAAGVPQYIVQSQAQDAELKPDAKQSNSESKSAKQVKAESQKTNESTSNARPSPRQTS